MAIVSPSFNNPKRKLDETSSEDSRSSSKKLKIYKLGTRKPAIPIDDIRRSFGTMFTDALNGGNITEINKLLRTYCIKDVVCRYEYVGMSTSRAQFVELIGRKAISKYWSAITLAVPDLVFTVKLSKVRGFPNGSCLVSNDYKFSGTQVSSLFTDDHNDSMVITSTLRSKLSNSSRNNNQQTGENGVLAFKVDGESQQLFKTFSTSYQMLSGLNPTPIWQTTLGTMCFYANPEKQITRIEFIFISATPME